MYSVPTEFVQPKKTVIEHRKLFEQFQYTKAYLFLSQFVDTANRLVQGKQFSDAPEPSNGIKQILAILDKVEQIFHETPPVERDCRYGNPSFKTFIEKLTDQVENLHSEILSIHQDAIIEVKCYFLDMFGSYGRLDYGSGHELNCICWILCFVRLQIIGTMDDIINLILRVFAKYMELAFKMQNVYTLEPAGSHGAWSVDDYNLLPFVFGSSQLTAPEGEQIEIFNECDIKSVFNRDIVQKYSQSNLYMRIIQNINTVKSYELHINSPFISELHSKPLMTWKKLNQGMLRHWHVEVLGKWPVIQHFWFGNIIPWN